MAEFVPEANPNPPSGLTLLDILKTFNSETGREFPTRWGNVNTLLSDNIQPLFENIQGSPYTNEELNSVLTEMTRQILLNSREIIYTKHLIALITFELDNQGITLESKELRENLKKYLKYK